MDSTEYQQKLARMESSTLLPVLEVAEARFIRGLATTYRFTYQELRQVSLAARDLGMWREPALQLWWEGTERTTTGSGKYRKKALLQELAKHVATLAASAKVYPESGSAVRPRRRVQLQEKKTSRRVLGLCPAYSEETVCCGLHTLDAVRGCPFSCSYCTIQTFYGESAELEEDLAGKLADLDLDPHRKYHIGTGQASDSLVWGNRGGILDALLGFAADNPNVLLELKTKSDNVGYILENEAPKNIVCSWSLNTPVIVDNEEHFTASLDERLDAARRVADRGVGVAFHFHPMVYYDGWPEGYAGVAKRIIDLFDSTEVSFVSLGSITLIKPVIKKIRDLGNPTKILQMELVPDPHGKLTYPDAVKVEMFQTMHEALAPWHEDVFMYLCMEKAQIWERALGRSYASNDEFELDFARHMTTGAKVGRSR